ncbi:MAG: hypothetical protein ACXW14_01595, partial [Burkholderiaceae bacterium]
MRFSRSDQAIQIEYLFCFWTKRNLRSNLAGSNDFNSSTNMQSQALNSTRARSGVRAGSYEELVERITERFPRLPGQLQRIARFAL